MIISSANDYREAARRRLPPFLFHYIDGGAYAEYTLKRNVEDLSKIALRQRVLNDMSQLSLETKLFDETLSMPVALSPVGLTGMYARRGEVQAAVAAYNGALLHLDHSYPSGHHGNVRPEQAYPQ
jgi:L-lactate dehydrogenase (cytochrome)